MRVRTEYGFYELNPFPGCNQIVVSNHSFINEEYRGKGIGTSVAHRRVDHAAGLGYDMMLATVCANNLPQMSIMKAVGWDPLVSFVSRETRHEIVLFSHGLNGSYTRR